MKSANANMDTSSEGIEFISEWPISSGEATEASEPSTNQRKERTPEPYTVPAVKKRKIISFDHPIASVALASWIRKNKGTECQTSSSNPKTTLNHLFKTCPEAKKHIECRLEKLEKTTLPDSPRYHFVKATYFDLLRRHDEALEAMALCLKLLDINSQDFRQLSTANYLKNVSLLSEDDKEALWMFYKLEKQLESQKEMGQVAEAERIAVDRWAWKELSVEKFKELYSNRRKPVVVTGLMDEMTEPWNLSFVSRMAGDCSVQLKCRHTESVEWAKLDDGDRMKVKEFVDKVIDGTNESQYLFDWSLPLFCPALNDKLKIPKYVQGDYLKRTTPSSLYHDSWPSLFIASKGLVSDLHIDAFGSNFWMALFEGRKRWTFYRPEDAARLQPVYHDSMDPVFGGPTGDVPRMELILEPGEVLFVPAGSPHRVENLEATVAVSGNYVDESNIDLVVKHLRIDALRNERAEDLLKEFITLKLVE